MLKILKVLRRANQNNCFQYKHSKPCRNHSAHTGQSPKGPNVRYL